MSTSDMYADRYHAVLRELDKALGPSDGEAEQGIAADVALLAQQRDEARVEIEHLRSQLAEAEDIASRLRTEVAEERRNFEDWALEFRRHQPVVQAARRWRVTAGPATAPGPDLRPPDAWKAADDLIAAVDVFEADPVVKAIRGALDATIAEEKQAGYYAFAGKQYPAAVGVEEIPQELIDILDARAGKKHSREGVVVRALAEILSLWSRTHGR